MQNVLQGLGLPMPPSMSQGHPDNEENTEDEEGEEDEEEEEEPEEQEGLVQQQLDEMDSKELVHSLNSSLEDLVVPGGDERGDSHSPILLVRRSLPKSRAEEKGSKAKETGGKKDKSMQETGSGPDIPIDSSGEEDASGMFRGIHVYFTQFTSLYSILIHVAHTCM